MNKKLKIERWWNDINYGPFRVEDENGKTQNLAGFSACRDMGNRLADHIDAQQVEIILMQERIDSLEASVKYLRRF